MVNYTDLSDNAFKKMQVSKTKLIKIVSLLFSSNGVANQPLSYKI